MHPSHIFFDSFLFRYISFDSYLLTQMDLYDSFRVICLIQTSHTSDFSYDLFPQYVCRVLLFVFSSLGNTGLVLSLEPWNIKSPLSYRVYLTQSLFIVITEVFYVRRLIFQILDLFIITTRVLQNLGVGIQTDSKGITNCKSGRSGSHSQECTQNDHSQSTGESYKMCLLKNENRTQNQQTNTVNLGLITACYDFHHNVWDFQCKLGPVQILSSIYCGCLPVPHSDARCMAEATKYIKNELILAVMQHHCPSLPLSSLDMDLY